MHPELKGILSKLKELRLEKQAVIEEETETQNEALPLLAADDPDNEGVGVEAWGERYTAVIQQNQTPEHWDLEKLVPWLIKNGYWKKVCTEILDQDKLEAEIRAGKISRSDLRRFKVPGHKPKAFIRFDKAKARRIVVRRRKR